MMNRARQEGRQNLFSVYSNVSVSMLLLPVVLPRLSTYLVRIAPDYSNVKK